MAEPLVIPSHSPAGEVWARLAQRVDALLRRPDARPYVQVQETVPAAAPLAWLAAQQGQPRFYWHARGTRTATAALGSALTLSGSTPDLAVIASLLDLLGPEARLFGGLRFDVQRAPDGTWTSGKAFRFTLPRITFTQTGEATATLTVHLRPRADHPQRDAILHQIRSLAPAATLARLTLPLPLSREDLPDAAGWARHVHAALAAFRRGEMNKVVLARRVTFGFPVPLDPFALLHRLEEATPGCFHFLTEHAPHATFVGASPERLFRLKDGRVESEAVAGTRPRSTSAHDDAALRDELLASDKDRREHDYVRRFLHARLAPLTRDFDLEAAEAMTLARGRHLRSRVTGALRNGVGPLDVLHALHPTPAVGGTPTDAALAFVRDAESFDRGRYAAPVGWVSRDAAEFAVGIRSGRIEGRSLALYSGAGIVEGSDPESEWDEIEGKISDFVAVLGMDVG